MVFDSFMSAVDALAMEYALVPSGSVPSGQRPEPGQRLKGMRSFAIGNERYGAELRGVARIVLLVGGEPEPTVGSRWSFWLGKLNYGGPFLAVDGEVVDAKVGARFDSQGDATPEMTIKIVGAPMDSYFLSHLHPRISDEQRAELRLLEIERRMGGIDTFNALEAAVRANGAEEVTRVLDSIARTNVDTWVDAETARRASMTPEERMVDTAHRIRKSGTFDPLSQLKRKA